MSDTYTISLNFEDVKFLMHVLNEYFYQKPVDQYLHDTITKQLNDLYINKKFGEYKSAKHDL